MGYSKVKSRSALISGLFAFSLVALAACSTGTQFSTAQQDFPEMNPGMGRIYIYRTAAFFGGGLTPYVQLNGNTVGALGANTSFYKDVKPGQYTVELHTSASGELHLRCRSWRSEIRSRGF